MNGIGLTLEHQNLGHEIQHRSHGLDKDGIQGKIMSPVDSGMCFGL